MSALTSSSFKRTIVESSDRKWSRVATLWTKGLHVILCLIAAPGFCKGEGGQTIHLADLEAATGSPSESCRPALTGYGGSVKWESILVNNRVALVEASRDATSNRFPICVFDAVTAADVDLSLSFTPIAGNVDQVAGLIFRFKDPDNYYVACADALDNSVNLYRFSKGIRQQIGGMYISVHTGSIQTIAVRVEGERIGVSFGDRVLFVVIDSKIRGAGAIGLWTKADSFTAFHELTVAVLGR